MDETTKELNREIKAMVDEMQSPERQEERIMKKNMEKKVGMLKLRIGL
jgi:hypothetical protein